MVETTKNVKLVLNMLTKLKETSGRNALESVASFLGYALLRNPIDPDSEWNIISHPELDDESQSLMALKYDESLGDESTVRELRKRYEQVEDQKEKFRGFDVYLYAFVGKGRILIFKGYDSNRDERLDLSTESVQKITLFADNFLELHVDRVTIQEDSFGFGKEVANLDTLFKRELSNLFSLTVQLYRKGIAELITSNEILENKILKLLPSYERETLKKQSLHYRLLNLNFKQAIGSVIDTIVLRVVLRRFLESYHGLKAFSKQDDFKDIGLGIREGKMQEVIRYLAEIEHRNITEKELSKVINSKDDGQMAFDFENVTMGVNLKETDVSFEEIYLRLRKQFEIAYGGDLFSSDISEVVNEVEEEINRINPDLLLHLMVDTSEDRFNFRYEDLPPEMIQDFYESSMGHSLQYSVNEEGKTVVSYSDDLQERKQKGAYYTRHELVDYMVNKTVGVKLDAYQDKLKEAIMKNDKKEIEDVLSEIIAIRIIDITCGGGSFLRGAFRYLSSRRNGIVRTLENIEDESMHASILEEFPYFANTSEAEALWEKHVLLEMVYGIDIDYKALIVSSQTLTLSALNNWKVGVNFPRLIGLTLIQQNALIGPVKAEEREKVFEPYKDEIKEMIRIRNEIRKEVKTENANALIEELDKIRLSIQERLNRNIDGIIGSDYKEALLSQSVEINFPEVFFNEDGSLKENGGFEVSIGNPPWEIWKPNADEFFEAYHKEFRGLKRKEKESVQKDILEKHPELREKWEWFQGYYEAGSDYFLQNGYYDYQRVKVNGRYTGGDINLYKISTEKNYQILNDGGMCSYLVPSSIYTDRGSTGLRKLLFNHTDLQEIAGFENRRRIFENVHSSYKFAVLTFTKGGKTEKFNGFFYKHYLDALHQPENFMEIPVELVKQLSPGYMSVLEFRDQMEVDLVQRMTRFPLLSEDVDGAWNLDFIAEFHMTSDSHLFNLEEKGYPLIEGKTIWQYSLDKSNLRYHVEENGGREVLGLKEAKRISNLRPGQEKGLKLHTDFYRIGYRAVASSTNKRSLIATIIPKHVFCGNSLITTIPYTAEVTDGEIVRKPNYSLKEMTVITALLNSFALDFMLRRKVSNNINMSFVYELPVPRLQEGDLYFDEIMKRSAKLICVSDEYDEIKEATNIKNAAHEEDERQIIQNQIDAYVAKLYGLTRDEFLYVLSTFKSAKHAEEMTKVAQNVIEQFDILTEKGELECPI